MARLFIFPGLLGGIVFLFWVWAIFDVIMTDSMLVRNMQKGTWIFLVLVLPTIGALAWVLLGRPESASLVPGGQITYENNPYRSERRPLGVEDTPGWTKPREAASRPTSSLSEESLAARERRLMEREAELAKREQALGDGRPDSAAPGDEDQDEESDDSDGPTP